VAAGDLWLRGRHLHRRSRPGRGTGARAPQGGDARHQARNHLHRGSARGIRARLRVSHVPRQCALRRDLSARHIDRAAADRQASDRDRPRQGADAVCHGATGKGNDQVRFELGYYALEPDIKIIAPWRDWDFKSREALLEFAEKHQIPIAKDKRGEAPFSVDANLLHSSSEGKVLEDPNRGGAGLRVPAHDLAPGSAGQAHDRRDRFRARRPVSIDGEALSPATLLTKLNQLGHDNGIGRIDIVENRFVGMKSRGVYETPGGTILLHAHRAIESLTLDRGAAHLKDELMPRYAELIYNGFWFAPEREMLQAADRQEPGACVRNGALKLYKGNVIVAWPIQPELALCRRPRDLRRRPGRLRSG
jgi:argininosuccinate synthase